MKINSKTVPMYVYSFIICVLIVYNLGCAAKADLIPQDIYFYTECEGLAGLACNIDGKSIDLAPGERKKFEFQNIGYLYYEIIDVELDVLNTGSKVVSGANATMVITPKVAPIIYYEDVPGMINKISSRFRAKWQEPIITLNKKNVDLQPGIRSKIKFDKIKLGDIIDEYNKNKQWPIVLKFAVTIEHAGQKEERTRELEIPFEKY